ncbi:MAG: thermonuclease family protein [Patescibacteria group bacterium]
MRSRKKKDSKSIIAALIMCFVSIIVNSALGQPIDLDLISKEVLGVRTPRSTGNCKSNSNYTAKVSKVVDGDTLEIVGSCNSKIRLLYVDTPETVKPNNPVECYGPEASEYTKLNLKENEELIIQTDKEATDRYGRLLGIVYKNSINVNDVTKSFNYELVEKGYAKAKFYSPNTKFKKEIQSASDESQLLKKGLWSKCN